MPRLSFRSTLLASFLLVAATLAAAAASGWLGLEALARAIHDDNRAALVLSAAARELGERTVDLERNARQFLVLGNPMLAERFEATLDDALGVLTKLTAAAPAITAAAADWHTSAQRIRAQLESSVRNTMPIPGTSVPPSAPDEPIDTEFQRLSRAATTLAGAVQAALAARQQAVMDALERERARVSAQILGAFILAAAIAMASAWWLLRPLARIEHAISALGDNRLGEAIRIDGPADLRQLGERLDWLRRRLAELEANRNRVLRHVSHELKTPLASIREGVALLADDVPGRLNPEQREVTRILEHSARTLQTRIEQLLRYDASQFDARRLDLQPTAIAALVHEAAEEHRLPARARGVTLEITGAAPPVHADAVKLRIAFSNLLANAITFSPAHGCVRIAIGEHEQGVRIDCTDEGPGIAADEFEAIFDPFFQGRRRAPGPAHGNGIGLAIVREFITAHGGRVHALASARGAHFRIELPRA